MRIFFSRFSGFSHFGGVVGDFCWFWGEGKYFLACFKEGWGRGLKNKFEKILSGKKLI